MTYLRWVRAETEATSRTLHWRVLRAGIPRTAGPSQPVNKQPAVTNSHNLQSKQPAVKTTVTTCRKFQSQPKQNRESEEPETNKSPRGFCTKHE